MPHLGVALVAALGFAVFGFVVMHVLLGSSLAGQDQTWYLYAAGRVLHGTQLYGPLLTETNPPLVIWISMVPFALAPLLHLNAVFTLYAVFTLLLLASTFWCYRLLGQTRIVPGWRALFALCIFLAMSHVPLRDFAQREQFCVMLLLPYFIGFGVSRLRPMPAGLAVALGVSAGLAVCCKPQQLLLFAAFHAAAMFHARSWKLHARSSKLHARSWKSLLHPLHLALAAAAATGIAYLAAIALFTPLYLRSTVHVLVNTYWAFGHYKLLTVELYDKRFFLLFGVALVLVVYRKRLGLSAFPALLLTGIAGSVIAYGLQRTGFGYQHIPQDTLVLLVLLWIGVEAAMARLPAPQLALQPVLRLALPLLAGAALAAVIAVRHDRASAATQAAGTQPDAIAAFYSTLPRQTPVFALSTNPSAAFPYVLEDHLVWASRFVHLWMLPAVERQEDFAAGGPRPQKLLPQATTAQLAELQRSEVAEDLSVREPAYVLVAQCYEAYDCEAISGVNFNMLAWFSRSPQFTRAWSAYTLDRTLMAPDGRAQWQVYRRAR
jgi:hypothetical protein